MKVETLAAYQVPKDILAVWKAHIGSELLPVQVRAVAEFGLFMAGNLIVFSPTSSGKTFIGEMAAVMAARGNMKVFYLVPQKALAAEKYHELAHRYAAAGIKVVASSRDLREHDEEILSLDFQIAVVVYEKLQALLVRRPQLMDAVGLVVVDELQMLTDKERGPTLELLLTKLRLAASKPRIIGLSAVLGRAQALAEWLGARLLIETARPVDLRKGVLCRGQFRYIDHNSRAEGVEAFHDLRSERREELLLAAVEELARRREQALVFLPDRASTVQMARVLAGRLPAAATAQVLEELRQQEETHAREILIEVVGSGVAFHNSDLSPEERDLVERHFRGGAIRVLFSTSTLAVGMNLPVKNVVLDHRRWKFLRRYGRWSLEELSRSEYENMSGRAGRLSLVNDFGRSILVTYSPFEADAWLRHFAGAEFEEILPTLADAPLEDHVLDLMASGLASTRTELENMLLSSFTGWVHWTQKMSRDEFIQALDKAIVAGLAGGLLRRVDAERLEVTAVGRVCASKGIGVSTGAVFARWADEARTAAVEDLEVLTIVSLAPAGGDTYVGLTKEERRRADYRGLLLARAAEAGAATRPIFERIAADLASLEYDYTKALKKTLLLADWIDELGIKELESSYHVWAGAVRRIGEEYGWLADAIAGIASASAWPDDRVKKLEVLAQRLPHGVASDAVAVAMLHVRGLGRSMVRRLVDAGLRDRESLRAAGRERLATLVRHKTAAAALWSLVEPVLTPAGAAGDSPTAGASRAADAPGALPPPSVGGLVVDLSAARVTYRGVTIPTSPPNNLQRQALLALACLAAHPGELVPMTDLALEMQRRGRLTRRLVTPEPREIRYRIMRPFRHALKGRIDVREIETLIDTVPGSGLRLNLAARDCVVVTRQ